MHVKLLVGIVSIMLMGCATASKSSKPERSFNATSMTVDLSSNGHKVLDSIPTESAMENFEMIDPQGRLISYVAFTDTDIGALVFVDHRLYGTLTHHHAQAFYSCRGYMTSTTRHWAQKAAEWAASLLANSKPAASVKLEFSGKSTAQSIKEVAENPIMKQVKSFWGIGTNPLGILNSLGNAKSDMEASDQFDNTENGLILIRPGMTESRVAGVAKPEDVTFVSGGMVMAYPTHLVEYYVSDGIIQVVQQPSLYFLSRTHAALFYAPNTKWPLCTPQHWKDALPETPAP
jgi:hypothetical protein